MGRVLNTNIILLHSLIYVKTVHFNSNTYSFYRCNPFPVRLAVRRTPLYFASACQSFVHVVSQYAMYPTPHSPFPDDKFITTRALTYSITDLIVPLITLPPCPSITPASITFSTLVTSQSCQFDPTICAKPLWKAD